MKYGISFSAFSRFFIFPKFCRRSTFIIRALPIVKWIFRSEACLFIFDVYTKAAIFHKTRHDYIYSWVFRNSCGALPNIDIEINQTFLPTSGPILESIF